MDRKDIHLGGGETWHGKSDVILSITKSRTDFIHNDHIPSLREYELMVERISERLLNTKKPYWHYYGKRITKEQAVKLLKTEFNEKIEL